MQLRINNIAKIKESVINIDGITVIAGENNTGKSTIGKLIFSIFNSMNKMEEKIVREKKYRIENILNLLVQNKYEKNAVDYRRKYRILVRKLAEQIGELLLNGENEKIEQLISEFIYENGIEMGLQEAEDFINDCFEKINAIVQISDEKVMMEIITRWFNRVFENQISPLNEEDILSKVCLTIRDKNTNYEFKNNICTKIDSEINLLHQAFYMDNPFVIDYMSNRYFKGDMKITESHLLGYLCKEEEIFGNLFEAIVAKDKLEEIDNLLSNIVGGEFIESKDGEYCIVSKELNKPLNVKNLSTGLKTFALIKRMLENGNIQEKDILILDEPEIHLHPEWQLAYAEIMVLLQKKFNLTMIITTHSPYFLDAIDVFSAKHEISNRVNYYLAENTEEGSVLQDVTSGIDVIYKKLSDPLQKLENIRSGII